jgi:hypothetical protein
MLANSTIYLVRGSFTVKFDIVSILLNLLFGTKETVVALKTVVALETVVA